MSVSLLFCTLGFKSYAQNNMFVFSLSLPSHTKYLRFYKHNILWLFRRNVTHSAGLTICWPYLPKRRVRPLQPNKRDEIRNMDRHGTQLSLFIIGGGVSKEQHTGDWKELRTFCFYWIHEQQKQRHTTGRSLKIQDGSNLRNFAT